MDIPARLRSVSEIWKPTRRLIQEGIRDEDDEKLFEHDTDRDRRRHDRRVRTAAATASPVDFAAADGIESRHDSGRRRGYQHLVRRARRDARGSAQGIITFISGGIGVLAGNTFSAIIVDRYRQGTIIEWNQVWEVPLVVSGAMMLVFVLLFKPPPQARPS